MPGAGFGTEFFPVIINNGGGGGGGVQSVNDGTGITVDNTDPQNPVVNNNGVLAVTAGDGISITGLQSNRVATNLMWPTRIIAGSLTLTDGAPTQGFNLPNTGLLPGVRIIAEKAAGLQTAEVRVGRTFGIDNIWLNTLVYRDASVEMKHADNVNITVFPFVVSANAVSAESGNISMCRIIIGRNGISSSAGICDIYPVVIGGVFYAFYNYQFTS